MFNKKPKEFLFVYGKLKREFDNEYSKFLKKNSKLVDGGLVHGVMYKIKDQDEVYPGLIKKNNGYIYGELYLLKGNAQRTLKYLDEYEMTPNLFMRERVNVCRLNNKTTMFPVTTSPVVTAWIYTYNKDVTNCEIIADGVFSKNIK